MSDIDDHISRLTMMVSANQTKWDLSPNDVIAIRWALGEALAAIEQTSGATHCKDCGAKLGSVWHLYSECGWSKETAKADGADEPGTTSRPFMPIASQQEPPMAYVERFVLREREACAKVCEEHAERCRIPFTAHAHGAEECARRIRARGKK